MFWPKRVPLKRWTNQTETNWVPVSRPVSLIYSCCNGCKANVISMLRNTVHLPSLSHASQHYVFWWPGAYLIPGHQQPIWWSWSDPIYFDNKCPRSKNAFKSDALKVIERSLSKIKVSSTSKHYFMLSKRANNMGESSLYTFSKCGGHQIPMLQQ